MKGPANLIQRKIKTIGVLVGAFFGCAFLVFAGYQNPLFAQDYTDSQIADAIYLAEGGAKTSHPYGILAKYKHTTPRQACLNTIQSAKKRFTKQTKEKDFIHFLSLTYCPVGCNNDNGTNKYWERNVKYFLKGG